MNNQIQTKTIPKFINQIPEDLINDKKLQALVSFLPSNYNFEIYKSINRINQISKPAKIFLQFPEGLLLYSCIISDILQEITGCECTILADVTYGACCVDDITAQAMQADLLIHYGHSCLVPITDCLVKVLYVFVEILIDLEHFLASIRKNISHEQKFYLLGTVQFNTMMFQAKTELNKEGYNVEIAQEKPRSAGEILGCTSPSLTETIGTVVFLCDGRFHMESTMIANPEFTFYQYDPYSKKLTIEEYDTPLMLKNRYQKCYPEMKVCIIFGILGRQGSLHILSVNFLQQRMEAILKEKNIDYTVIMVSELTVEQINLINDIDYFVQLGCPRLSIDWGLYFPKPLLNSYEFYVLMQKTDWRKTYPMDFYSNNGGEWSSYYHKKPKKEGKIKIAFETQII